MWEPKLRTPGIARSSWLPCDDDAPLLRQRRARLGEPVHEEVLLLELGEQLLARAGARSRCRRRRATPSAT